MMSRISYSVAFLIAMVGLAMANSTNFMLDESEDSKHSFPPLPNRRLSTTPCSLPRGFAFTANFQLSTYYTATCSANDVTAVLNAINTYFDNYVAYHAVLGPIDLVKSGSFCPNVATRRHRRTMTNEANAMIRGGHRLQDDRDLVDTLTTIFSRLDPKIFTGGGMCRYCGVDNADKRMLQTNLYGDGSTISTTFSSSMELATFPITLSIKTDQFPAEMGYTLEATDGSFSTSQSGFSSPNTQFDKVIYLEPGQKYKLTLSDGYGDGWCCSYGNGFAKIYQGLSASGTPWLSVDARFGAATSTSFTAQAGTPLQKPEDVLPSLQQSMTDYMTYYLQQNFHYSRFHCFWKKFPTVMVVLKPAPNGTATAGTC